MLRKKCYNVKMVDLLLKGMLLMVIACEMSVSMRSHFTAEHLEANHWAQGSVKSMMNATTEPFSHPRAQTFASSPVAPAGAVSRSLPSFGRLHQGLVQNRHRRQVDRLCRRLRSYQQAIPVTSCGQCRIEGNPYRGDLSFTERRKRCVRWDSFPHRWSSLTTTRDMNFCRNPDQDQKPWCFIGNAKETNLNSYLNAYGNIAQQGEHWDYCQVPGCKDSDRIKTPADCHAKVAAEAAFKEYSNREPALGNLREIASKIREEYGNLSGKYVAGVFVSVYDEPSSENLGPGTLVQCVKRGKYRILIAYWQG